MSPASIENHAHKKDYREIVKSIQESQNEVSNEENVRNHFNQAEMESNSIHQETSRKLSKNEATEQYLAAIRSFEAMRNEMWKREIEKEIRVNREMESSDHPPGFFATFVDAKGNPEICTCSTISETEEYAIVVFRDQGEFFTANVLYFTLCISSFSRLLILHLFLKVPVL